MYILNRIPSSHVTLQRYDHPPPPGKAVKDAGEGHNLVACRVRGQTLLGHQGPGHAMVDGVEQVDGLDGAVPRCIATNADL